MDEKIIDHVVEVKQDVDLVVDISESMGWVSGDDRYHDSLLGVNSPNQHIITAITGLREELDEIERLKPVESNVVNVANYYKWNGAAYADTGFFVSLVKSTDLTPTIQLCDGKDIFGVSVDSAGFIGGQSDVVPRGESYGLIATSGLVYVKCEQDVVIGDTVVSNKFGYAKKSHSKRGYRVLKIKTKNGDKYAAIMLGIQADVIDEMCADVEYIGLRLEDAEQNLVSVMLTANQAYAKANECSKVSNAASDKVDGAIGSIEDALGGFAGLSDRVSQSEYLSSQAQLFAESASLTAIAMRKEAEENANKVFTETAELRDEIHAKSEELRGGLQAIALDLNGAKDDFRSTCDGLQQDIDNAYTILNDTRTDFESTRNELQESIDAISKDLEDAKQDFEEARNELQGSVDDAIKDLEDTKKDFDSTKNELQGSLNDAIEDLKDAKEDFAEKNEEFKDSLDCAIENFEGFVKIMDPLLTWPEGSTGDDIQGVAGFVKQANENGVLLGTIAEWKDGEGENSLAGYIQEVGKGYATTAQISQVGDTVATIKTMAETNKGSIEAITGVNGSLAGLQAKVDKNSASVATLASHVIGEYTSVDTWSVEDKNTENIYYAEDTKRYWYYDGKWKSTKDITEAGLDGAIAGVKGIADANKAQLDAMVSYDKDGKSALAGLTVYVDANSASISTLATYNNKDTGSSGVAGLVSDVDDNTSELIAIVNHEFRKNDGTVVTGLAGLNAYVNDTESNVAIVSDRVAGEYVILDSVWSESGKDTNKIYYVKAATNDEKDLWYYYQGEWKSSEDPYDAGLPRVTSGLQAQADNHAASIEMITSFKGDFGMALSGVISETTSENSEIQALANYTYTDKDGKEHKSVAALDAFAKDNESRISILAGIDGGLAGLQAQVNSNSSAVTTFASQVIGYTLVDVWNTEDKDQNTIYYANNTKQYYYWGRKEGSNVDEWVNTADPIDAGLDGTLAGVKSIVDDNKAQLDAMATYDKDGTSALAGVLAYVEDNSATVSTIAKYKPGESNGDINEGGAAGLMAQVDANKAVVQTIAEINGGIAGLDARVENNISTLATLASQVIGEYVVEDDDWSVDGRDTKTKYYVTKTKNYYYYKDGEWKYTKDIAEAGLDGAIAGVKSIADSNKAQLDAVASYTGKDKDGNQVSGLAGLATHVDANSASLKSLAEYSNKDSGNSGIAGLIADVNDNTATLNLVADHSGVDKDGKTVYGLAGVSAHVDNNESKINTVADRVSGQYTIVHEVVSENKRNENKIYASYVKNGTSNILTYYYRSDSQWKTTTGWSSVKGKDNNVIYYVVASKKYWYYKDNAWTSSDDPYDAGLTRAVAGVQGIVDENKAQLDMMASYDKNGTSALAGVVNYVDENSATVSAIAKYEPGKSSGKTSDGGAAGLMAQVDENTASISAIASESFTKADGTTVSGLAGLQAQVGEAQSQVDIISNRISGKYIVVQKYPEGNADSIAKLDVTQIYYTVKDYMDAGVKKYVVVIWTHNGSTWEYTQALGTFIEKHPNVLQKDTVYFFGDQLKYYAYYKDNAWRTTNDAVAVGLSAAISGIQAISDDHSSMINSFASWQGATNLSMARIDQKADANGAYIQSTVSNMEKYSVGPSSQAYGFTLEQASKILEEGMIYVPTVRKQDANAEFYKRSTAAIEDVGVNNRQIESVYYTANKQYVYYGYNDTSKKYDWIAVNDFKDVPDYKREFFPGYLYMWGRINGDGHYGWITVDKNFGGNIIEDGTKDPTNKINASEMAVYFNATEIALTGQNNYGYWYANGDTITDLSGNTGTYEPYTLYKWDLPYKYQETNNGVEVVNKTEYHWVAVATLAGNSRSRSVSQIRQDANRIEASLVDAQGNVAELEVEVSDHESRIQGLTTWKNGELQETLSTIQQKSDSNGSRIAQVAANVGGYEKFVAEGDRQNDKVYYNDDNKIYYYYKNGSWLETTDPFEAGVVINAASIVTAVNNAGTSVVIDADHIDFHGKTFDVAITDEVKSSIDNIEIGCRNLLLNSKKEVNNSSYILAQIDIANPSDIVAGEEYTVSFDGLLSDEDQTGFYVNILPTPAKICVSLISKQGDAGEYHRYTATFTMPDHDSFAQMGFYSLPLGNYKQAAIKNIKLEVGNQATGWTPAPEDQVAKDNVITSINASKEGFTIKGDKINISGNTTFSTYSSKVDNSITSTVIEYALSKYSDKFEAIDGDDGKWSIAAPQWRDGAYMWQQTTITKTNGAVVGPTQTCIQGSAGKGVNGIVVEYHLSNDAGSEPTTDVTVTIEGGTTKNLGWTSDFSEIWKYCKQYDYIWSRERVIYTDGPDSTAGARVDNVSTVIAGWCDAKDKTLINGAHIATGTVTASQIAADAITADKIAADAITARNYYTKDENGEYTTIKSGDGMQLNLEDGTWDSKNFKISSDGSVNCSNIIINDGIIRSGNYTEKGLASDEIFETEIHVTSLRASRLETLEQTTQDGKTVYKYKMYFQSSVSASGKIIQQVSLVNNAEYKNASGGSDWKIGLSAKITYSCDDDKADYTLTLESNGYDAFAIASMVSARFTLRVKSATPIYVCDTGAMISLSDNAPEIKFPLFSVDSYGRIKTKSGEIGGYTLENDVLTSGTDDTLVMLDASDDSNYAFSAGSVAPGAAPFSVAKNGVLNAYGGTFSGNVAASKCAIGPIVFNNRSLNVSQISIRFFRFADRGASLTISARDENRLTGYNGQVNYNYYNGTNWSTNSRSFTTGGSLWVGPSAFNLSIGDASKVVYTKPHIAWTLDETKAKGVNITNLLQTGDWEERSFEDLEPNITVGEVELRLHIGSSVIFADSNNTLVSMYHFPLMKNYFGDTAENIITVTNTSASMVCGGGTFNSGVQPGFYLGTDGFRIGGTTGREFVVDDVGDVWCNKLKIMGETNGYVDLLTKIKDLESRIAALE